MSLGDLLFGVRSEEDRVLGEGVTIVREFAGYSLSICCPRDSDLDVLETIIRAQKGAEWTLARDEPDFINGPCDENPGNNHVLLLSQSAVNANNEGES